MRQIFKCNNYLVTLIDLCVKTFLNYIFVPKRASITVPKQDLVVVLSLNLISSLYNFFNKTLPQCKLFFNLNNCLSNLIRFKVRILKELRSHLVYEFLCSNCNIIYYGESERHLSLTFGEYLSLNALIGKRINSSKKIGCQRSLVIF